MPATIDNIELDTNNAEFNYAVNFIRHTDRLVYLTGKAGTGKTTFLRYVKQAFDKNTVVLAPTGVAAIHAGGQTIHSFFQIKPGIYYPQDKRLRTSAGFGDDADKSTIYDHFKLNTEKIALIMKMQLLIIDEISMVRCDLLDVVDRLLRVYRRRMFEPFGGVQVVLIGDTFQLPPIADHEQWEILSKFYKSPFFFSAAVIARHKPVYIELKKIYRQREQDFIELLNKVRVNQMTQHDLVMLNRNYDPLFTPPEDVNYIELATHNRMVDETNLTKLAALPGDVKLFEATITSTFPDGSLPADKLLQLKEGAQIMFLKNDKQKRFYNGKIAVIKSFIADKIVITCNGDNIVIEKETWSNIRYVWNDKKGEIEEEAVGVFTQYPLRLAWGITIHKSQGLTFDHIIADLAGAFAPGQVYVALSRCTSFNGLVLKTKIERNAIKTDTEALQFARNETPGTLINDELNSGRADFHYKKAREMTKAGNIAAALENFLEAITFRNDMDTEICKRYLATVAKRIQATQRLLNDSLLILINRNKALKASPVAQKQLPDTAGTIKKLNERLNQTALMLREKTQKLQEAEKRIFALNTALMEAGEKIHEKESA